MAPEGIGIHHERHREHALAIGERLGIYRDYPVSKRLHVSIRADLD
jgi:hypothetical protein